MTLGIEARNIHLAYGKQPVLADTTLTVERGSVYGLLGRNGAGKTTLLNVLAGMRVPDQGSIQLDGIDLEKNLTGAVGKLGYVPDQGILPGWMRVKDAVDFESQFRGPLDLAQIERALADSNIS